MNQEHAALRATVEEFARKEVAPVIADLYEHDTFPYALVAKMGAMGLFGLPFPEEYGGMGGDYFALCLALEELARVDSSVAITLEDSVSLGAMPIFRYGTEEQKQRWLPELCTGQRLGAFGLTEPGGGSDAGATRTTARCEGDEWVINGSKAFITNSGTDITSVVTVTAITGVQRGPQGDLYHPGPRRAPRLHGLRELLQSRLAVLGHPRAVLRRLPGAAEQPTRRARPRLCTVPGHSR